MRSLHAYSALILLAINQPLGGQTNPAGCISFTPTFDPARIRLVQTVSAPGPNSSALIAMSRAPGGDLGGFLRRGGSLVMLDDHGQVSSVLNRDTLDEAVLASGADLVKLPPGQISSWPRASVPIGVPRAVAPVIGTVPQDWQFATVPQSPLQGVDIATRLGQKLDPYGMIIGGFDGEPAPAQFASNQTTPTIPDPRRVPDRDLVTVPPINPASATALAATVAIYFRDRANPSQISRCNGVQVAPGLILTNLHCASPRHDGHVVHFGTLNLQADALLPGSPVSGAVSCPATVYSPPVAIAARLDFAVLRIAASVPEPYRSAVVPLDNGTALRAQPIIANEVAVTQIQYWMSSTPATADRLYRKFRMRPPNCAISKGEDFAPGESGHCNPLRLDSADRINPAGLSHRCDADEGSSGSPMFDPQFSRVVALHRGGGAAVSIRNCAVPAAPVLEQLIGWGFVQR